MVAVVTANNRALYREQLTQMHRDRKRVFVDKFKWDVSVVDGEYEIDQFDTPQAVYLMELDPQTRCHLSSVRLLPTTQPHLLDTLFPELCDGDVPSASHVWEITRYCTNPDVPRAITSPAGDRVCIAMVEYALLHGITRYTYVTHMKLLSLLISQGWETEPLGLPCEIDGQMLGAMSLKITPATLQMFRDRYGYRKPMLEMQPAKAA
jgi:N-acyl-L-homoserine lactone synthetase